MSNLCLIHEIYQILPDLIIVLVLIRIKTWISRDLGVLIMRVEFESLTFRVEIELESSLLESTRVLTEF